MDVVDQVDLFSPPSRPGEVKHNCLTGRTAGHPFRRPRGPRGGGLAGNTGVAGADGSAGKAARGDNDCRRAEASAGQRRPAHRPRRLERCGRSDGYASSLKRPGSERGATEFGITPVRCIQLGNTNRGRNPDKDPRRNRAQLRPASPTSPRNDAGYPICARYVGSLSLPRCRPTPHWRPVGLSPFAISPKSRLGPVRGAQVRASSSSRCFPSYPPQGWQ